MQVFKKYMDDLPRINFNELYDVLQEGDTLYEISGNERDFGGIDIIRIGKGTRGGLSYFYEDPRTGKIEETETTLAFVLYKLENVNEKIRQDVNTRHFPLLKKDKIQRQLAIKRGELIVRYILEKKDGTQYAILI